MTPPIHNVQASSQSPEDPVSSPIFADRLGSTTCLIDSSSDFWQTTASRIASIARIVDEAALATSVTALPLSTFGVNTPCATVATTSTAATVTALHELDPFHDDWPYWHVLETSGEGVSLGLGTRSSRSCASPSSPSSPSANAVSPKDSESLSKGSELPKSNRCRHLSSDFDYTLPANDPSIVDPFHYDWPNWRL